MVGVMLGPRSLRGAHGAELHEGCVDDYQSLVNRETREFGTKTLRKPFARDSLIEQLSGVEVDRPHRGAPRRRLNQSCGEGSLITSQYLQPCRNLPASVSDRFRKFTEI
jgi:hypothetical protein